MTPTTCAAFIVSSLVLAAPGALAQTPARSGALAQTPARSSLVGYAPETSATAPPAPPARDTVSPPATPPPYVEPEAEQRGFVLDFTTGLAVPSGSYATGVDASSMGVGLANALMIGTYLNEHIGLLGGAHVSYRHQGVSGCPSTDACGGLTYAFPVVVQYAFHGRKQGAYLETGLSFAPTYIAYAPGGTLNVSGPADLRLGAGYRFTQRDLNSKAEGPSRASFELYARVDAGQFSHATINDVSGDIDRKATHYTADLGVALHWTP